MSTALNAAGVKHAHALVAAGKVNEGKWDFSSEDGNALLGAGGDDWTNFAQWFLAIHPDASEKTKGHYGYPFGKGGEVYRNAVASAKGRAAQQDAKDVEAACSALLDAMDALDKPKHIVGELMRRRGGAPMLRAWARMEVKEIDGGANPDGEFTIKGIASTPETDRMGDIVVPTGAKFSVPMPLLWQHASEMPIGRMTFAKPNKDGIPFEAVVARKGVTQFIDDARALIREGLVGGVSIGFVPKEFEPIDPKDPWGGQEFKEWEWLELSVVTIPANSAASIQSIKSFDQKPAAPSGTKAATSAVVRLNNLAGASAPKPKEPEMKTITEQIAAFEAKRAANQAATDEIMAKSAEEGATLDKEQAERYDGLQNDICQIDEHLKRLRAHEKSLVAGAKRVEGDAGLDDKKVKHGDTVMRTPDLPKGMGLARYVKALAYAKGNNAEAQAYAKQWEDSTPEVLLALKSAIAAGTTQDSAWAGPLVYNQNLASEFVSYLRPQTILGKLTGIRRVPFNIRYVIQNAISTVGWVGEGAAKPVSKAGYTSATLGFAKAAGIVVISQELARFSSPSAELNVRDDLTAQMIYFLDQQFIDPGVAAVANTNPASVTNSSSNVVQSAAVWSSLANIIADVRTLLFNFAAQEISLENCYWVMTPNTAIALSLIFTTNGQAQFPGISVDGGTFLGMPVIVSNSVPHSTSAGAIVALVKASEILLADDDQVSIDVSQEASLQMDSAPTQNSTGAPTATSVVSMFQTNSIAIRAERVINWAKRRTYAVGYIDNVHTT